MVKIGFGQVTYNKDFENTKLCIQRVGPYVDNVIIAYDQTLNDGQIKWLDDNREKYNIVRVRFEFKDNFPMMRNVYLEKAKELGMNWLCVSDPDELYGENLCKNLRSLIEKYDAEEYSQLPVNVVDQFSNIDWLDDLDKMKECPGGYKETSYWKPLLIFKLLPGIRYEGVGITKNLHETLVADIGFRAINLPKEYNYIHNKSALMIWRNAARNLFISGGGDNVGNKNPLWRNNYDWESSWISNDDMETIVGGVVPTVPGLRNITDRLGILGWNDFEKFVEMGVRNWEIEKEKEIKEIYSEDSIGAKIAINEQIEIIKDGLEKFEQWLINALQIGGIPWATETRETAKWFYALHMEEFYWVDSYGNPQYDDFILDLVKKPPMVNMGLENEIENFVIYTYFKELGRHPDEFGKKLYVEKIKSGIVRREEMGEILRNSKEYKDKFRDIIIGRDRQIGGIDRVGSGVGGIGGESDININIDINDSSIVEKFVDDTFKAVLERPADGPGRKTYIQHIMGGRVRPSELGEILKDSNEYRDLLKKKEREKMGIEWGGYIVEGDIGVGTERSDSGKVVGKIMVSPFERKEKRRIKAVKGFVEQGGIEYIDEIDSSKYNTVALCIMGYKGEDERPLEMVGESIRTIGKYVDEIHVQLDNLEEEDIRKFKELEKEIGKDIDIHIVSWKDNFSDYKNKAVSHATTEWILVVDHDEIPTLEMAKKLKDIILKSDRGNNFDQVSFDVIDIITDKDENGKDKIVYEKRNSGGKPILHWNVPSPYTGHLHIWLRDGYYPWKGVRSKTAYKHVKTRDEILERSARNVVLGGGGDTLEEKNPLWRDLTNLRTLLGLDSWSKTNEYLKKGNIDERMIKIFEEMGKLKWKDDELKDLKKYYLKRHPMEEGRFK